MEVEEFSKRTIDLNNNLERLMPALSAHVGKSYSTNFRDPIT